MARFYFHVLNDIFFVPDEDGVQLEDVPAARQHARKILAEIIADELLEGRDAVNMCVLVDKDDGTRVTDMKAVTRIVCSENPFAEV